MCDLKEIVVTSHPKSFNNYALSRTDDFSDFEIQCETEKWKVKWKVHKIVISDRSTVFKNALKTKGKV